MKPSASTYLHPNTLSYTHSDVKSHSERSQHCTPLTSCQDKKSVQQASDKPAQSEPDNPSSRTTKRNQDQSTGLPVELQCSPTIQAKPLSSPVGTPSYRSNPQTNTTQNHNSKWSCC
ncbi:hypothetical protein PoB_003878900 [Plakobranchus ocellatus]|uniref:Uncharacterized protein n=1 Tax=Plakobranchus ocellatus TaxID=259542 RepID=A0AAV4B1N6_9GAST|nr:hypothetical protein PoB_003878900 [Plakobranchus ocellatus]